MLGTYLIENIRDILIARRFRNVAKTWFIYGRYQAVVINKCHTLIGHLKGGQGETYMCALVKNIKERCTRAISKGPNKDQ